METCSYCKRPVILVPTAQERAKRYGGKPSDYTALFPNHAKCILKARAEETKALAKRLRG